MTCLNLQQDFFLDLIFAPVETTPSSSSKVETDTETEAGKEKQPEDATVDASKPAPEGEDTAAVPPPPPGESNAATTGKPDEAAAGAEGGADAENSAVARSEWARAQLVCHAYIWHTAESTRCLVFGWPVLGIHLCGRAKHLR